MNDYRERLAEAVGRIAGKCDYAEARIERVDARSVAIREGRMDHVADSSSLGGCLRVCCRGGWGFASFNDLSDIDRFAESALEQARAVGRDETMLAPVEPVDVLHVTEPKDDPRSRSIGEIVELLQGYDECMGRNPGIDNRSVQYSDSVIEKTFVSSDGTVVRQRLLDIAFAAVPVACRDGRSQSCMVGAGSSDDFSVVLGLEDEIERKCALAVELVSAPKVKAGVYTVIVDPELAGVFVHEAFGHTSEADNCSENPQLAQVMKLGAVFGSPILNIYDTGLDRGSRGFVPYDDEGVPGRKTWLIREGRLVGRLHSRETAARLGEEPSGNARAVSYRFPPVCRMRNTCIAGGETSFEDMLASVDEGIYVVGSHGGCGGEDFSFSATYGVMIRKGRLCEKVSSVKLSGNLWKTLKDIDAVGDDFRIKDGPGGCGKGEQFPLPVSHSAPHILIRDVTVGGDD